MAFDEILFLTRKARGPLTLQGGALVRNNFFCYKSADWFNCKMQNLPKPTRCVLLKSSFNKLDTKNYLKNAKILKYTIFISK